MSSAPNLADLGTLGEGFTPERALFEYGLSEFGMFGRATGDG